MTKNFSLMFGSDYLEQYEGYLFRQNFKNGGDIYCTNISLTIDDSTHNALQTIKSVVEVILPGMGARIEPHSERQFCICIENKIFLIINTNSAHKDMWEKHKSDIRVECHGTPSVLREFKTRLKAELAECKSPAVEWHYMARGYRDHTTIFLENRPVVHKEYYPWLDEDPNDYIDRFMQSKCGLLILRGEPGTGKTSFIRNILWRCDSKAMITYEEDLFKSDDLFVDFLTDDNNVLIMEDADAFLESRIRAGNTTMTKFLNVSDGIIDFPGKKLIISANTVDNEKIDEALLRPGRCFDAPIFRRLSFEETLAACDAAGIMHPTEERSYSLAEMFSNAVGERASSPKSGREKFGFGR